MKLKITPAITLSALLITQISYATDWDITDTQTKTLTGGQRVENATLTKNGKLTLNSTGNNAILKMTMYRFNDGAEAKFNVNNGTLDLGLTITNPFNKQHSVDFTITQGATLNLTAGKGIGEQGVFQGSGTTLTTNISGTLNGSLNNDGATTITLHQSGTMQGNIIQSGSTLTATIDGRLDGNITINRDTQTATLNSNGGNSTITGSINQEGGSLNGTLNTLTLEKGFTQIGGISNLNFTSSAINSSVILNNSNATINFQTTQLKNITATGGEANLSLSNSSMEGYTGNNSRTNLTLQQQSTMLGSTQSSGTFTLNSTDSNINGSITGSNNATLNLTADSTRITGSISNTSGTTNLNTGAQTNIQGNINQNGGFIDANLRNTAVGGGFNQIQGTLINLNVQNSTIQLGIHLDRISSGNTGNAIRISDQSVISNGIHIKSMQTSINGSIDNSTVNGGYIQDEGQRVALTFNNNSTLTSGINAKSTQTIPTIGNPADSSGYLTALFFQNGSSYDGGIISTNHSTWVELDRNSTGNGDIAVTGGYGAFLAKNQSIITGNITSQDTIETRVELDGGTLNGNITQTNGRQYISLQLRSTLNGSINNTNTQSTFINRSGSTLQGSYTQTNGSLDIQLGGDSIITGDLTLYEVRTTISNGFSIDHREVIKGSIFQNGGSLQGKIGGLNLQGQFIQNGGISNVTFDESSSFEADTWIKGATKSDVTFNDNTTLKNYTIENSGKDNSLLLDNNTTLEGSFKLINSSAKLSVKNGSKITGSIFSEDKDNELDFDFSGPGTEIGGNIIISKGKAGGTIEGTTIKGDLKLTDAESHFHFINSSLKNIEIFKGTTMMTLDRTSVTGHFHMKENGPNNPTLKLKISNGSSIGEELLFENTKAFLGGEGLGNSIGGDLISTNSTLTNGGAQYGGSGNPLPSSGLTIKGNLRQESGILDLTLTNQSSIKGETIFNQTQTSHLTIDNNSSIAKISIDGGTNNLIIIQNQSQQSGDISLKNTTATIKGLNQSRLKGNITATSQNSDTHLDLDNSHFIGNITQNNGNLTLDFKNNSSMQGNFTLTDTKFNATLNHSLIKGDITETNSPTHIILTNQSKYNGTIRSTNSKVKIDADNSEVAGNIDHTFRSSSNEANFEMNFTNNATLNNKTMTIVGKMQINSNNSSINSSGSINLTSGTLDIFFDNQSVGTINKITTASNNKINITTTNTSNNVTENIELSDQAELTIFADNAAILAGNISTQLQSKANLTAINNAQLRFNITPAPTSSLDINLNGGILFGSVLQTGPLVGTATLATSGGFGGRWIMTTDSAIKNLTLNNSSASIENQELMQRDSFDSPISMVDMTKDALGNSRIGLAIVQPTNAELQPTQTLAKTLSVSMLDGNNGVFRVYTDLGSEQSDKLTAQQATGNHTMQVYYNPSTFTEDIGDRYIVITHVDDPNTSANFEGGTTDIGTQSYKSDLLKVPTKNGNGFDWILGKAKNIGANYGTKIISSILQSQYRVFALQAETLNQRLGELKDINKMEGIWARYQAGESTTKESQVNVDVKDTFYSIWLGYDHNQLDLRGQDFYGFALNYTSLTPKGKDYTGELYNIGFNFYNTFIARNDFYVDIVAKYILSLSDYKISYYALNKNTPNYTNHKFLISAEIGKKFKLGSPKQSYFYLKPEAQITSGYIHENDITFVDNIGHSINSHLNYTYPVLGRIGLFGGYSLNRAIKGDIMLGASLVYEMNSGGDVLLDDGENLVHYKHSGAFKAVLSARTNWIFNDAGRIYLEAQTDFLGNTSTNYAFNAGVRFTFGHKNTRRLKVPGEPPPPPPKPEYDPRNIPTITDNTKVDIQNNNTPKRRYQEDYFINTRKAFRDGPR